MSFQNIINRNAILQALAATGGEDDVRFLYQTP